MSDLKLKDYERFVLTEDIPEEGLKAGDVGKIIMTHKSGEGTIRVQMGTTVSLHTSMAGRVLSWGSDQTKYVPLKRERSHAR